MRLVFVEIGRAASGKTLALRGTQSKQIRQLGANALPPARQTICFVTADNRGSCLLTHKGVLKLPTQVTPQQPLSARPQLG
jgi:hypothetical protein